MIGKTSMFIAILTAPIVVSAANYLLPNAQLQRSQYIETTTKNYKLIMQDDGSLVMYRGDGTKRYGMAKGGEFAVMQSDGNFVEYSPFAQAIWNTGTQGNPNAWLHIQDDGNLVVYSQNSIPLWNIGAEPSPNDPAKIADVVGRDLNVEKTDIALVAFITFTCMQTNARAWQFAPPSVEAKADPAELLKKFSSIKGTPAAKSSLEVIDSKRLPVTVGNFKLISEALAGKTTVDERVLLIRILGNLHRGDDPSLLNSSIRAELKAQAFASNREVARAATFAISRTGNYEDSADILVRAQKEKLISNDEYAGEIARTIRFVPKQKQAELISILAREDNGYGFEVLVADISNPGLLTAYGFEAQKQLYALLRAREPLFPLAIGLFGYVDAIRFAGWLNATSLLHEKTGSGSANDYILQILYPLKTDPRKIIGFLSSPEGKNFLTTADRSKIDTLLGRARDYADSFPQNLVIRDFVDQLFITINGMK